MADAKKKHATQREVSPRRYGSVSTIEGRRAVPSVEGRSQLSAQRERLMSKDTKVGKTRYE